MDADLFEAIAFSKRKASSFFFWVYVCTFAIACFFKKANVDHLLQFVDYELAK